MELDQPTDVHNGDHMDLSVSKAALTPPTSDPDIDTNKDGSSSELSDIELDDDDIGEIEPDHYFADGEIPVFKPTMEQFRSFKKYIDKIDKYGMKSGIVKVIPPQEWRDSLPALDEAIKTIKVKNPIMQEFAGTHGTYTQANIEKQRSYNLPQWKALTEEHHHQPPGKRGERRRVQNTTTRSQPSRRSTAAPATSGAAKRKPGRPKKRTTSKADENSPESDDESNLAQPQVPPTPTSPDTKPANTRKVTRKAKKGNDGEDDSPTKARGRQPKSKSISSRRMNNRRDVANEVDEEAFKGFDCHLTNADEFTDERCRGLEENYWKTLNYGTPMYGADMPGSLFDDTTTSWNVAKLENLLDILGTKVPGVNTAYLYLGMWKATFAWHLEDVDLYSINYIHFGAPKQWYSISQKDARRFEAAMKSIWPDDAKNCDQFLRHKTYLISPEKLKSQFNIRVNKLIHREGEFVITYPYGYHSGFNLGYNCAESVNFATEAWLNYGRIAKKCDCEADSVWVDVGEIERKLRGEPTPEYYEETDDEEDEEEDEVPHDLPSPPASVAGKPKVPTRKRKRDQTGKDAAAKKTKRIKIRIKAPSREPCILCPNDIPFDVLLPTDNGQKAHRLCALYTPETYLVEENGVEKVCNVAHIDRARIDLKCNHCRSKRGACFQCSAKKCTRAYHATCAAAAGVLVDAGPMPTFGEDGTEYFYEGYDFRCRFHRPKRAKTVDSDSLESVKLIRGYARNLQAKDVVQAQYLQGEVFAGVVVENRACETTVVIDVVPDGDRVEVEWKWLLVLDPVDSQRQKPSPNAIPLPDHLTNDKSVSINNRQDGLPEMDTAFHDPNSGQKWAEFNTATAQEVRNPNQKQVDLFKSEQIWFYLGKTSTEARAQYTEDPAKPRHNAKSVFMDTVKPPPKPPATGERRSFPASYPMGANVHALNGAMAAQRQQMQPQYRHGRPYQYKPKSELLYAAGAQASQYDHNHQPPLPLQPVAYPTPPTQQPQRPSNNTVSRSTTSHMSYNPDQYPPVAQRGSQDWVKAGYPYQSKTYTQAQVDAGIDPRLQQSPRTTQGPYHMQYQAPYQPPAYQQPRYQYPSYHSQPQQPQQQHPQQRVAPVANMLNGASSPPPRPSTTSASPSNSDYIAHIQKYPYLRNSYLRRPKTYQSPYAPNGGFTPAYMPIPPAQTPTTNQPPTLKTYQPPMPPPPSTAPAATTLPSPQQSASVPRSQQYMQYQSPQDFQRQVSIQGRDGTYQQQGMSNFERLIQQLGSYNSGGHLAGTSGTSGGDIGYDVRRGADGAVAGSAIAIELAPRPVVGAPPGDVRQQYDASPGRPEYSPLTPRAPMPPEPVALLPFQEQGSGIGGDGWRFG